VRIVGRVIRGLRVSHRGPTHSLTCLALWAVIAAPLYVACGGAAALALAWVAGKLAAIAHAAKPVSAPTTVPWLLGYLAVVYPYAVVTTALGYLSHLVLDALTAPIPWGWPFAARRVALVPAALRIHTGSGIETWLVRPAITIAAVSCRGRGTPVPSALTSGGNPADVERRSNDSARLRARADGVGDRGDRPRKPDLPAARVVDRRRIVLPDEAAGELAQRP
jgi:membrane-bound metal-dependent hydrolase YbcI (DUF457 family)